MRKAEFGIMTGNQELGLKSVGQKSSDYSAGIPIKKRRFPLYQPPSPPEEETPLPAENDLEQRGHSSPSQGPAVTDAIGLVASSNNSNLSATSSIAGNGAANSSGIYVAAVSSVSSNLATLDANSVALISIVSDTPAVASASISGPISNAGCLAGDLNPSIAETGSNANVFTAGSSAGSVIVRGSFSDSLGGSAAKSVAAISNSGGSEGKNTIFSEHGDDSIGVRNAISPSTIKQEEPSFALCSDSLAEIVRAEKPQATRRSATDMVDGMKTEFNLATDESSTLEKGKQILGQEKVVADCNLRAETAAYRKTELCLGFGHHSSTAMVTQTSESCSYDNENLGSVTLSLSLSKNGGGQQRSGCGNTGTEGANMMPNRSIWDLNMTIDDWEDPNNNDGASQKDILGPNPNFSKPGPLIANHSTQIDGACLPSQSHISEQNNRSSSSAMVSTPSDVCTDYSLRLGLVSSSVPLNLGKKPLPRKVETPLTSANVSVSSVNTDVVRIVKSEQLDDVLKQCTKSSAVQPNLGIGRVKQEVVEIRNSADPKSRDFSTFKSGDLRLVKHEAAQNDHLGEKNNRGGSLTKLDEPMLPTPDDNGMPDSPREMLLDDNAPGDGLKQGVDSDITIPKAEGAQKVIISTHASEGCTASVSFPQNQSNISGITDDCMEGSKTAGCNIQDDNEVLPAAPRAVEGSVSDDEKINLSEEASFVSDYESDGTPNLALRMDSVRDNVEEDLVEDGEVWEPSASLDLEVPKYEKMELQCDNTAGTDCVVEHFEVAAENRPPLPSTEEDMKIKDPAEINNDESGTCVDISFNKSSINDDVEDSCLPEALEIQIPADGNEEKKLVEFTCKEAPDLSGREDTMTEQEAEQTSNEVSITSQETSVTVAQGTEESGKRPDIEEKNGFGTHIHEKIAAKDANSGGTRSRIINLSRASNSSSLGKTRSISRSLLSSQVGRERLPDAPLEGDKVQHRWRDDLYGDGGRKFSRERHQNHSSGSSRLFYPRGRGRFSRRIGPLGSGRDSGRNFAPEFYDGQVYGAARHRYASSMADADPDLNSYDVHNGSFMGTGRGGRKFFNDNSSSFSHFSARRRSPGDSDGHNTRRGIPMIRRIPGNISRSGCTDKEEAELSGSRHARSFQNDRSGPTFIQTQSYEELDGSFGGGNRNFQSLQRRGLHGIRSKSPMRARTRSPGPWSPPGRSSQDAFGGSSELLPRRSSPFYRIQRIRSPERPCFPREMVIQRHGSPPFVSRALNDLRDMDSARDHNHLRPAIHNGSPSGQVLLRNSRRLDLMGPLERTDCDSYYRGPVDSARYELGSDDNCNDRRRFGERQGPVRSFTHTYSSAGEGGDFLLDTEDSPRTYRFCAENNCEYHESGNLRGREFDRRVKHRVGDVPARRRSIGEQEEDFRHGTGQVWHGDRFDDMSRVKRKRF